MDKRMDIPEALYEDEAVCFIADRYHTTPGQVVQCFLRQNEMVPDRNGPLMTFHLENNEMEILRGLIHGNHS